MSSNPTRKEVIVMKTAHSHNSFSYLNPPKTDAHLQDELDVLMDRASQGDRRAVAAIAVCFGPSLHKEARAVLGRFKQEAADVLQDFFVLLLEGRSRFTPPVQGRAIPWMFGMVRAIAREHRADRERERRGESEP
jgi:DNA-directed RNA polymerase specialized sigma24 family protein